MSLFSAVGWLLGVPPADQRREKKERERDYTETKYKFADELESKLNKFKYRKECDYKPGEFALISRFPKEFVFSGNKYLPKVIDKFYNDYLNGWNKIYNQEIEEEEKIEQLKKYCDETFRFWYNQNFSIENLKIIIEEIDREEKIKSESLSVSEIDKQIELLKLQKEILELKNKENNSNNRER